MYLSSQSIITNVQEYSVLQSHQILHHKCDKVCLVVIQTLIVILMVLYAQFNVLFCKL